MAKEFFKNLPDTTTPLNAQRMNSILNGEEAMGSIVVEDITCKNLFNKNSFNVLTGFFITGSGQINAYGACKTLYIPIVGGETYTISKIASARFIVATYTSAPVNNSICTAFVQNNSGTTITIEAGANDNYLAVFYFKGDTDTLTEQQILDSIQIEKGSVATDYVPHKEFSNNEIKEDVTSKLTGNGVTIVSARKYKFGNFVNYQVVFTTNSAISNTTDLITGFEKPMSGYSGVVCFPIFNNNSQNIIHGILSENASLRNYGSISSGQSCRCNIVYTTSTD